MAKGGRNFLEGTHVPLTLKTIDPESSALFREASVVHKKRGRAMGTKMGIPEVNQEKEPSTPFEALRQVLKLPRSEWCKICNCSLNTMYNIELGKNGCVANVALAKRIQEEARKRNVAVTLDELFQHVALWE